MKPAIAANAALVLAALVTTAPCGRADPVYTLLSSFNGTGGEAPEGGLVRRSGHLIGTTSGGGANGLGTVFSLHQAGGAWHQTILHSFAGADGANPNGTLLEDGGVLYGTTEGGGQSGQGTVFALTPSGGLWVETVLHSFAGADGASPRYGLIHDAAGNLYGATSLGGAHGKGAVFELSPGNNGWTETVLYSFKNPRGSQPSGSLLLVGGNTLYGTANTGGDTQCKSPFGQQFAGCGTVFELRRVHGAWRETTLHVFSGGDGANPVSGLIRDAAGNLYGTTDYGGASGYSGTVFELSPTQGGWVETVLHSFTGADGAFPKAGLVFAGPGTLYGTAAFGGAYGYGTAFSLTLSGGAWAANVLHNFGASGDGTKPACSLVRDESGNLYGTASGGGESGDYGGVFELTP